MSNNRALGRVLVTGASGIVGWSIVEALCARGHEVRVVARNVDHTRTVLAPGVDVVPGDLLDAHSLAAAVAMHHRVSRRRNAGAVAARREPVPPGQCGGNPRSG